MIGGRKVSQWQTFISDNYRKFRDDLKDKYKGRALNNETLRELGRRWQQKKQDDKDEAVEKVYKLLDDETIELNGKKYDIKTLVYDGMRSTWYRYYADQMPKDSKLMIKFNGFKWPPVRNVQKIAPAGVYNVQALIMGQNRVLAVPNLKKAIRAEIKKQNPVKKVPIEQPKPEVVKEALDAPIKTLVNAWKDAKTYNSGNIFTIPPERSVIYEGVGYDIRQLNKVYKEQMEKKNREKIRFMI